MKHPLLTTLAAVSLSAMSVYAESPVDAVIPLPAHVEAKEGAFILNKNVVVTGKKAEAHKFIAQVKQATGIELNYDELEGQINFVVDPFSKQGGEGYTLDISNKGITVSAKSAIGHFYGAQTILQMIDKKDKSFLVPAAEIKDKPRFAWRGLMLDESRHFFGKEAVKLLIDNMAARKMNRFHWHLTDDEGWRVEVKGYPKLTEIGAWRGKGTKMPRVKWRKKEDGKGKRYGGFYTQEDLKEIVAYAKERHIEIIPEIDMPGHVTGLVTAYPEMAPVMNEETLNEARKKNPDLPTLAESGDSARAYRKNVMSMVRPENYEFCAALFDQLTEIFPYQYWHIGGDEVHTLHWEASPEHQALMKERGFTDPHQLQNLFLKRMATMLRNRGRIMIGWNEIMKGGKMPKDTAVMGWLGNGPGIKAAQLGYPTIMANSPYNYFDMIYPGKGERSGHSWAGPIDSKKSYEWNPLFPEKLNAEQQKNVIGVHACVWTEYVPDAKDMSYKFWPRAASVAEVGWTPQEKRNWSNFKERLGKNLSFFDANNTFYRVAPPRVKLSKGQVTIEPTFESLTTKYTLDGSDPREGGKVFKGQTFTVEQGKKLKAYTVSNGGIPSIVIDGASRDILGKFRIRKEQKEAVLTIDVTDAIDEDGKWVVFAKHTAGRHHAKLKKISVSQEGIELGMKEGDVLLKINEEKSSLSVDLSGVKKDAKKILKVTFATDGGIECRGEVTLDKK